MEKRTLDIHFGLLCDTISEQLKKQNFKFDKEVALKFDRIAEAINTLSFDKILTDGQKEKLQQKLFNKIQRHIITKNRKKQTT